MQHVNCSQCTGPIPILPKEAVLTFLAEGAANVIYKVSIPSGTTVIQYHPSHPAQSLESGKKSPFHGKLLRLRKDVPHSLDTVTAHSSTAKLIHPGFPLEHVVHQQLVSLASADWISLLNHHLQLSEHESFQLSISPMYPARPAKRRRVYLANDDFGMLVDDMRPANADGTMVEFKPKWLAQSPSAPPGSVRCRNCARRADRAQKNLALAVNETTSAPSFCPLSFFKSCLDSNTRNVQIAVGKILSEQAFVKETIAGEDFPENPRLSEENKDLIKWLTIAFTGPRVSREILSKLEADQRLADRHGGIFRVFSPTGTLTAKTSGFTSTQTAEDMCKAMTLRDCTLFVRISHNGNRGGTKFSARLGDLDVKSREKGRYWYDTEKTLIDNQWYQGRKVQGSHVCPSESPMVPREIIRRRVLRKLGDIFGAVDHFSTISEPVVDIVLAGYGGYPDQISALGNGHAWEELTSRVPADDEASRDVLALFRMHSEVLDCHLNGEWTSAMARFKIESFREDRGVAMMEATHRSMEFEMGKLMSRESLDDVDVELEYSD